MSPERREFVRFLGAVIVSASGLACGWAAARDPSLWECNWCHQQYQGDSLPAALRFAKCPAKEMKQSHFWSKKN